MASRPREWRSEGGDDGDLTTSQIGGQAGQPLVFALRPTVFNRYVFSLDEAKLVQAFLERSYQMSPFAGRCEKEGFAPLFKAVKLAHLRVGRNRDLRRLIRALLDVDGKLVGIRPTMKGRTCVLRQGSIVPQLLDVRKPED